MPYVSTAFVLALSASTASAFKTFPKQMPLPSLKPHAGLFAKYKSELEGLKTRGRGLDEASCMMSMAGLEACNFPEDDSEFDTDNCKTNACKDAMDEMDKECKDAGDLEGLAMLAGLACNECLIEMNNMGPVCDAEAGGDPCGEDCLDALATVNDCELPDMLMGGEEGGMDMGAIMDQMSAMVELQCSPCIRSMGAIGDVCPDEEEEDGPDPDVICASETCVQGAVNIGEACKDFDFDSMNEIIATMEEMGGGSSSSSSSSSSSDSDPVAEMNNMVAEVAEVLKTCEDNGVDIPAADLSTYEQGGNRGGNDDDDGAAVALAAAAGLCAAAALL